MFRVKIRTGQKYVFYMHNNDVLFDCFAGVPNHCASDRAIQAHNISRTICIIIIIMSSAWYGCVDDVPIRSTLALFDVKLILFDFLPSACKYFILKMFQNNILKIIAKDYGNIEKIMKTTTKRLTQCK